MKDTIVAMIALRSHVGLVDKSKESQKVAVEKGHEEMDTYECIIEDLRSNKCH